MFIATNVFWGSEVASLGVWDRDWDRKVFREQIILPSKQFPIQMTMARCEFRV